MSTESVRINPREDHRREWVMHELHPGEFYVIRKDLAERDLWGNVRQILRHDRATCEALFAEFQRELDLYGVFWAGDAHEVQRGDEEERFPGDMEAAVHVAQVTDCHWLLYVEDPDRWRVIACSHEDYARGEVEDFREHNPGAEVAFYFDGRLGLDALEDGPDGIGYRLKAPEVGGA